MPSLKDLKNRIESVKNTRKITKAMQMVAAAKLRRAQEAAEAGRPYAERFNAVLGSLAASVGGSDSSPMLLRGTGSDQTHRSCTGTSCKRQFRSPLAPRRRWKFSRTIWGREISLGKPSFAD